MAFTKSFLPWLIIPTVIQLTSPLFTVATDYIARVPVYLDGSMPRQLVRYKELPYKDVFRPPCVYPGALIEEKRGDGAQSEDWMCSLRCECIENGNIWCWKKCDHTQAELSGKKCLVTRNDTAGACCPKIQCDDKLKRKKLVAIKTGGTPPGVELFCERGKPMPLSFCSTFSMSGDKYDWGRIPSMARCGPGPMQCLEYYRDYAVDPAVNDSVRSYLYTSSLNSTTELTREEVRATEEEIGRERVVQQSANDAAKKTEAIVNSPVLNNSSSTGGIDTVLASGSSSIALMPNSTSGISSSDTKADVKVTTTAVRFRET